MRELIFLLRMVNFLLRYEIFQIVHRGEYVVKVEGECFGTQPKCTLSIIYNGGFIKKDVSSTRCGMDSHNNTKIQFQEKCSYSGLGQAKNPTMI